MSRAIRQGRSWLWMALCLLSAGCFQIDTHVAYHEDGSATITERVNLSRTLLDMDLGDGGVRLEDYLSRASVEKRMASMGKGMQLISHKVVAGAQGSRESVAVFKIADLNEFRYVSPWLAYLDYPENSTVAWRVVPMYKSKPYGRGSAGSISIQLSHQNGSPKGENKETAPPRLSPSAQQVYRELSPVFTDMLDQFRLRLTFEAYAPVNYAFNPRGQRANSKSVDIINVTSTDLDRYGYRFFENEEVMLDLIQWQLGSDDVVANVKDYGTNLTEPVFTPLGSRHMWFTGGNNIHFRPSKPLFDRYFAGKKLDYSQWRAEPPEKHVPADFKRIGYHPPRQADGAK